MNQSAAGSTLAGDVSAMPYSNLKENEPLRAELYGLEGLEAHALHLGAHSAVAPRAAGQRLLRRFVQNSVALVRAHRLISEAYRRKEIFGSEAEWLLDNFHIMADVLAEVRLDLPRGYYKLLPKLASGPLAGFPRVYAIALEIVVHCDSCLDQTHLTRFVNVYQTVAPLTIGELWAVPIMLRVVLVDNLRRLAEQILSARAHCRDAQACAARCIPDKVAGTPVHSVSEFSGSLSQAPGSDTFVVHLLESLREHGPVTTPFVEAVEGHLGERGLTPAAVLQREQQRQAANQVSIGNCVTSLRLLSTLDWPIFFEDTSLVEALLRKDPAGVYERQDFPTRDRYRQVVEKLARGSGRDELDVARAALDLCERAHHSDGRSMADSANDARRRHVGYYLIDRGRREMEAHIGYRAPWGDRLRRTIRAWPGPCYFSALTLLTILFSALAVLYGSTHLGPSPGFAWPIALALLAVLPASELAKALVNYLASWLVPPRPLPRLDFKAGIPADCATIVVMPSMLVRPQSAARLLDRLEIHYLSNPDSQLRYALLTDFADARTEHAPEDDAYLASALDGVKALNARYEGDGPARFFLFHRRRLWNPAEGCWMGWERKRGKLAELNRLLRGARDTSFTTLSGDPADLQHIRFVITLDIDTQLPHEAAQRLIATLAHPLNQPSLDAGHRRVVAGYGVLQPRVGLELTAANQSLFSSIFAGSAGIDPYTTAVSDVYQDLFDLGSFTGKGIYDVDAFEAAVGDAFPENQVLSHDLIEGNYARCGLVSDVELLDGFPSLYPAYARREHRWARGDWQILPWLFRHVPGPRGRLRNPLTAVERWKIFDNLRRSLVPPALVVLLILSWTILPGSPWFWAGLVSLALAAPLLLQVLGLAGKAWRRVFKGPRLGAATHDVASTAGQVLLSAVFLADQAWRMLDAVLRTLVRQYVTRRHLLMWETSASTERLGASFSTCWRNMGLTSILAAIGGGALVLARPEVLPAAFPFLAAWIASPLVAFWVSRPRRVVDHALAPPQQRRLRLLARQTWSYFETFVTDGEHWLPPDNYQEDPKKQVAHRTSPTNVGLYLLSSLAAHDFGYLTLSALLDRLEKTLDTIDRLDRFHGHLLNWYDTQTLQPLPPSYVSTVDSGNFLGCLLTLKRGLLEKLSEPLSIQAVVDGFTDTLELLRGALQGVEPSGAPNGTESFRALEATIQDAVLELAGPLVDLVALEEKLSQLDRQAKALNVQIGELAEGIEEEPEELRRWATQLEQLVAERRAELAILAPWLATLRATAQALDAKGDTEVDLARRWQQLYSHLAHPESLSLHGSRRKPLLEELVDLKKGWSDEKGRLALSELAGVLDPGAGDLASLAENLAERVQGLGAAMDFKVLYNHQRHLFAVGYNLAHGKLDSTHYDLLASEACLTSFLAIARGDVPKKHWFQLGRPLARAAGSYALLSWGGTMFEYLMPRLLLPTFPRTLLHESQKAAVARQIEYGRQCHVPWGVSESAYSAVDREMNYQYQAFGVPGLGLKRGLAKDLVVAPYATVLAVMVSPSEAVGNVRRLEDEGASGPYGLYEAIDYTRDRVPDNQRSTIVKCFMAHHQGMSLVALGSCLLRDPMVRRLAEEPMVRATQLLLQERVPQEVPLQPLGNDETALPPAGPHGPSLTSRRLSTPHTAHPRTQMLSSGQYSVMITNAGAGRSVCRGLDVTRWREDRTRDCWGQFVYVCDFGDNQVWSAGFQPICRDAERYEVVYSIDKAEFRRLDNGIETHMEVAVSPETHAEVRRLTFSNHSPRARELEITSYVELVLGPHAADLAHPAFGKLFLETEYVPAESALLCHRRRRSDDEKPVWGLHVLAVDGPIEGAVQFETDRARFLGRGRTPANPAALDQGSALAGTLGPVLDPIFSLRCRIKVEADASISLAFTTALADTREAALAVADHYHDFHGVSRAFDLAWAHSHVELQHLHVSAEESHLFQRLAAHIYYAAPALRAAADVLSANRQGQSGLWRQSISGDNPIVLLRVNEVDQLPLARQLLAAHSYWRTKGLIVDLVVFNDHEAGYFEGLQEQLQNMVRGSEDGRLLDKPGGVFLRKTSHLSHEDQVLIQSAARCVVVGGRGSLSSQLDRLEKAMQAAASFSPEKVKKKREKTPGGETPPSLLPADLLFPNGLGGFTPDGLEYLVSIAGNPTNPPGERARLKSPPVRFPPAPWINVICNPSFGFLVSESGGGFTWSGNSQTNRLTPWSNDPVSDHAGEVIYLCNEETGAVWTATPSPIPGRGPYLAKHGQGYTIFEHEEADLSHHLLLVVPPADPIKLLALTIHNRGSRALKMSATFYAEWVLGTVRDQAAMHAITEVDVPSGALLARNRFNADFPARVAFADVNVRPRALTGDRTEFLGRNGSTSSPAGCSRGRLSGSVGAALDPCAVIQAPFELGPGEKKEIVFLLGQAEDLEKARALLQTYRMPGRASAVLTDVRAFWERALTAVQVRTPNAALDLLLNRWLLYQVLACRVWGRSALYQSSGAYGFRDQLQDVCALVHAQPEATRAHLLLAASRQFREGDAQHWWHPPGGAGVRTRISDDFLWLPFAVCHYVQVTGDQAVLDEQVPFLQAPVLRDEQEEDYRVPEVSNEVRSLYEHCLRAIEHGLRFGPHGLPLMGSGDWNDGMNHVGRDGKGESIWNGWFLVTVLRQFSDLADSRGDRERADQSRKQADDICAALETHGWDGEWYRRAYFDDGTPLGSAENDECRIDSLPQSWAVISGTAEPERARKAMASAERLLVRDTDRLIALFTPPFDKGSKDPGYVKGYVPGIRENGGQYTHAAAWVVQATALLGQGTRAVELLDLLNPILHTVTPEDVARYRAEPYVLAGDVYSAAPHVGRAGWTWYTGSAGWLYRVALETILGLQRHGTKLRLNPSIPSHWKGYEMTYHFGTTTYRITIENPDGHEHGVAQLFVDGVPVSGNEIDLIDDRGTHSVRVSLG